MTEKKTEGSRRARRRERTVKPEESRAEDQGSVDGGPGEAGAEPEESETASDSAETTATAASARNRRMRRAEQSQKRRGGEAATDAEEAEQAGVEGIRARNRRTREEAARRRRAKRSAAEADEVRVGLDASEMVDDVLARATFRTTRWIRNNSILVQSVAILSFVGLIGWTVYGYVTKRAREDRSDVLFSAVDREGGHVGEPWEVLNPERAVFDPRPTYASEEERLNDTEQAYREALQKGGKTQTTTMLAQLGLAAVLLNQGKYDEALTAYQAVSATPLAKQNVEARGRTVEGVGLCLEGKGDQEAALEKFQELQNFDAPRFNKLGMYHRARLLHRQGKNSQAKTVLAELKEKLGEPAPSMALQTPNYLHVVVAELEMEIDPSAGQGMGGMMRRLAASSPQVQQAAKLLEAGSLGDLKALGLEVEQPSAPSPASSNDAEKAPTPSSSAGHPPAGEAPSPASSSKP